MTPKQQRILLFLIGCIGVRLAFVVIAANVSLLILRYLGFLALIPAIGFVIIYTFGLRKSGPETLGAPIWWNYMRPIHALCYSLFAYTAINGNKNAYIYLLLDVILGLTAFFNHHLHIV